MMRIITLVPRPFREHALTRAFIEAFEAPFIRWSEVVIGRGRLLDPERAPEAWLDYLLFITGWPSMPTRPAANKRAVLALGAGFWRRKGQTASIESYLRALTDVSARVYTLESTALYPGVTTLPGPEVYPGDGIPRWFFVVEVPTGSIDEDELRRLLRPVVPLFTHYDVTYV